MNDPPSPLRAEYVDDDLIEVTLHDRPIAAFSYDEVGYCGMDAILRLVKEIADQWPTSE